MGYVKEFVVCMVVIIIIGCIGEHLFNDTLTYPDIAALYLCVAILQRTGCYEPIKEEKND